MLFGAVAPVAQGRTNATGTRMPPGRIRPGFYGKAQGDQDSREKFRKIGIWLGTKAFEILQRLDKREEHIEKVFYLKKVRTSSVGGVLFTKREEENWKRNRF